MRDDTMQDARRSRRRSRRNVCAFRRLAERLERDLEELDRISRGEEFLKRHPKRIACEREV